MTRKIKLGWGDKEISEAESDSPCFDVRTLFSVFGGIRGIQPLLSVDELVRVQPFPPTSGLVFRKITNDT